MTELSYAKGTPLLLLTITFHAENAPEIGYLLHKNPASIYEADLAFGKSRVFYALVEPDRITLCILLSVDPIALVRGPAVQSLTQYVNDRPYVASSLLSVAIADAFGAAMSGRSRERPERVEERVNVSIELPAVDCAGGEPILRRLFEPLGYSVSASAPALDSSFPEWGESRVLTVCLEGAQTVQDMLTHLYVLVPVLDNDKHYFIGEDEVAKLLSKGDRWLPTHPERELITRRYLGYRQRHVQTALAKLREVAEERLEPQDEEDQREEQAEAAAEAPMRLNEARIEAAIEAVRQTQPAPTSVIDLGCGEGRILKRLLSERGLKRLVGVDVAAHVLARAERTLRLDGLPERERERITLLQGSLVYRDERFSGFDVALLIEVIEHLDPPRLAAIEKVVFRHARPGRIVITTPNREYNAVWESLPAGTFRHRDHRFEWGRAEFRRWADRLAESEGYRVHYSGIGPAHPEYGAPTQMAIFDRSDRSNRSVGSQEAGA